MNREQERALLLFVVATVLIATPVRAVWLQTWWSPFAFWLSMIAVMVLLIPFLTGYLCANLGLGPTVYRLSMLIHILAGETIFVLMPFTKVAHCVLMPFSQLISNLAWKFPPAAEEPVTATLNKKGAPV